MTSLKWIFVVITTTLTALSVFLLLDILLVGAVALTVRLFSYEVAINIYKYGVATLFVIELLLTIPAVIKTINKGDKS